MVRDPVHTRGDRHSRNHSIESDADEWKYEYSSGMNTDDGGNNGDRPTAQEPIEKIS